MQIEYENCVLDQNKLFEAIGYAPHPKQWILHNSNSKFRVLACGRRWGKSLSAAAEIMKSAVVPNQMLWCVGPTYELANKVFREVYKYFTRKLPHWIESKSESRMHIKLINGTVIEGKSADNPDSLIGEGVTGMVVDEGARIKKTTWEESLLPTLTDKDGWCIAISTPRGRNWFHEIFVEGQDKLIDDVSSWTFASITNPYLDPKVIAAQKRRMTSRAAEQEYDAIFLTDTGGVFRNVRGCVKGTLRTSGEGGLNYVMGVDLAKYQDFTVIIVIDTRDNSVVFFDRFNKIDWKLQKERIIAVAKRFNDAKVHLDATGLGDPILDDLRGAGLNIIGHKFNNTFKNDIIDNLSMMIETQEISFPEIEVLINELTIFEYEITASGRTRLNAPEGYHDDCVCSLALGCIGAMPSRTNDSFGLV